MDQESGEYQYELQVDRVDNDGPSSPTNAFYVQRHTLFAKEIRVLDMTSHLDLSDAYPIQSDIDHAMRLAKRRTSMKATPAYTISRSSVFNQNYAVKDEQGNVVAYWKHPVFSAGAATLDFPPDSSHSSHTITSKALSWARRTERFVQNSVTYSWEFDCKVWCHKLTLFRIMGNKKARVGLYQESSGYGSGYMPDGMLWLDSRNVDKLVGLLTLVLVLRKNSQRHGEQRRLV